MSMDARGTNKEVKKKGTKSRHLGIKANQRLSKVVVCLLLILLSIIFIIPFVWLVSSSLKTDAEIFITPPKWIPNPPIWKNYLDVIKAVPFWHFVFNSLKIGGFVLIGHVFASAFVAYGFARLKAPGKNMLFLLLLLTMMLPGQVTMIPMYVMFSKIGWVNTHLPLIVPAFAGSAFYIFLMRQFFTGISMSLDEAAKMDGAGHFTIFWKIIMPMSKAVMITVALFSFVGSWNDFMGPLIYLNSPEKFTMGIGLNMFKGQFTQNWNYTMAFNVMMILPILLIFFFAQKKFIQGIVITGVKG